MQPCFLCRLLPTAAAPPCKCTVNIDRETARGEPRPCQKREERAGDGGYGGMMEGEREKACLLPRQWSVLWCAVAGNTLCLHREQGGQQHTHTHTPQFSLYRHITFSNVRTYVRMHTRTRIHAHSQLLHPYAAESIHQSGAEEEEAERRPASVVWERAKSPAKTVLTHKKSQPAFPSPAFTISPPSASPREDNPLDPVYFVPVCAG